MAENTSDAVVGTLLWGAIGGPAGVAAFRAANTLDAMVGHRSPRYREFGWAPAKLDDALCWPAARAGAGLAVLCAPLAGGSRAEAWHTLRRDGAAHPSPNAGRMEAAFAGALGLRLGGPLAYDGRIEDRPALGDGRAPIDRRRAPRDAPVEHASARPRSPPCARRVGPEGAMSGALLVCGTHSDAGKSVITAGLCRWLKRRGVSVAPFKAQNMALNSVVTRGRRRDRARAGGAGGRGRCRARGGHEPRAHQALGRAPQPGHRHGPALRRRRRALATRPSRVELRDVVAGALADLRARYDVVICEGAGSPAEINLRAGDIANLGLARAAGLPVLVVGDIDRGGVFASLFGTLALLEPADQALIAGFVINKFRGDPGILAPGLDDLRARTGRPVLGVLPVRRGPVDGRRGLARPGGARARGAGRRRHARRRRACGCAG